MEDGFPLFDPNDEAARQEQRLREYYEEFSANARKRLLSKIVNRPTSVYDVLYPKTRELLLSKNVPINNDLEENAKLIRDSLIAKLVTNETDLEKISADFRNSMLARAKIQDDKQRLLRDGEAFRKNLISKNSTKSSNIERDSQQARNANVSKNKPNPSIQDSIDKNSPAFRDKSLAKNVDKEQDLLQDSEAFRNQYRKNDIHKNVPIEINLEKDSEAFRTKNLSKNTEGKKQDIDEISKAKREESAAKNAPKESDIESISKAFRNDDLAKNSSKEQDLLRDSEDIRAQYREKDLNKNVPNNQDIERDNELFRKDNLSKNKDTTKSGDLESDSEMYRNNNLSLNSDGVNKAGIEEIGDSERSDELSRNKSNPTDLESDSAVFRDKDLSLNVAKTSDLEKDSVQFRSDDLSANKPSLTNLEEDSTQFRADDLSANKPSLTNLEEDSAQFRADDLSLNKPKTTDLEIDSVEIRKDDLALNKPSFSDLEKDSVVFRSDDLSFNKPNKSNLEVDSVPFRSDDLSLNKPSFSDLEIDSVPFRDDDLSFNTPNFSDLESDSGTFRADDLAANIPIVTDLETDSVPFREDDLSANSPNFSDLAADSTPFLFNNLSSNVPSYSDLETDSVPFRNDDLSANVPSASNLLVDSETFREDDLSANVPNTSDLATDSVAFRAGDLAANVPVNTNIASDSVDFRDDALSKNVPLNSNLLTDSTTYRDDAKAKNDGYGLLGVNVNGAGTSSFLGISRVFTQGILVRQLLFSKNKPKNTNLLLDSDVFRDNNKIANRWQLSNNEYTSTNENWKLGRIMQGSYNTNLVDYSPLEPYYTPTAKAIFATDDFIVNEGRAIQASYGTSQSVDFPTGRRDRTINDALFSVDTSAANGGVFLDSFFKRQTYVPYTEGTITSTIRRYNQERNAFNLKGLQPGDPQSLGTLEGFNEAGFQDLVQKTIGSFRGVFQSRTLTTPASIIQANGGAYYKGGNNKTDITRPESTDAQVGTAESMMAKTTLGNPFDDEDFLVGRRGVKHIVNTIKTSSQPLAPNFDPQNNRAYITGVNRDGTPRVSKQRYTIANPYAPQSAGKLVFLLKNYASEEEYSFPPYIQSIQNTENANWNSHTFLGRPEAVYTYNNSTRDASISFFVLTDYAQKVDIGRNWESETMDKITADIPGHFTQSDYTQNEHRKKQIEALKKKQKDDAKKADELSQKIQENNAQADAIQESQKVVEEDTGVAGGVNWFQGKVQQSKEKAQGFTKKAANAAKAKENAIDEAELQQQKKALAEENAATEEALGSVDNDFNIPTNYSEQSDGAGNIYNINVIKKEFIQGPGGTEIISKPDDTINRINAMKQTLMFQPAFFSGDKVDFVRKVEFLSKLTRPAANDTQTGFSFTSPPVCHIHLGDWWNHDIVVNSVSFDYSDAPWTLEGGRVQPMWVLVSINFNMIGPFKSYSGRPPLATDAGGMYSPVGGITKA